MPTSLIKPGVLVPFSFGASQAGWHSIQPFTICPKEYQLSRVRGISQRSPYQPLHLGTGAILHTARAQWFNDEYKLDLWRDAVEKYIVEAEAHAGKPFDPASKLTAIETFEAYVAYWRPRGKTTPLAVEWEVTGFDRTARLDSVELAADGAWVGEFKSTSKGIASVTDMYLLNGQTLMQALLCKHSKEFTDTFGPFKGILLDALKKPSGKRPAEAYPRVRLPVEQMESTLKWFERDLPRWIRGTERISWNADVERRPVCQRAYGPCEFKDLCLLGKGAAHLYQTKDGETLSNWKPSDDKTTAPWD